jgi:hypothetical protein
MKAYGGSGDISPFIPVIGTTVRSELRYALIKDFGSDVHSR